MILNTMPPPLDLLPRNFFKSEEEWDKYNKFVMQHNIQLFKESAKISHANSIFGLVMAGTLLLIPILLIQIIIWKLL